MPTIVRDGHVLRKARWADKLSFIYNVIIGKQKPMSKLNYTPEMVETAIKAYKANVPLETIAFELDRSVRSVRSKLVREGVYIAKQKPIAIKSNVPTKKELLRNLEIVAPFSVTGFENATKDALQNLINEFERLKNG
jgi:hypothetical protein